MDRSIFNYPNTIEDIIGYDPEVSLGGKPQSLLRALTNYKRVDKGAPQQPSTSFLDPASEAKYKYTDDTISPAQYLDRGVFNNYVSGTSPYFNADINSQPQKSFMRDVARSSSPVNFFTKALPSAILGVMPQMSKEIKQLNEDPQFRQDFMSNRVAALLGQTSDLLSLPAEHLPPRQDTYRERVQVPNAQYDESGRMLRGVNPAYPNAERGRVPLPSEQFKGTSKNLRDLLTSLGVHSGEEDTSEVGKALDWVTPFAAMKGLKAARQGFSALNRADSLKPLDNVIANDTISPASLIDAPRKTNNPEGVSYVTGQQGPFFRVTPSGLSEGKTTFGGIKETNGGATGIDTGGSGSIRGQVPQRYANEEVERLRLDPNNFLLGAANKYTNDVTGAPIAVDVPSSSSLAKQSAIGSVFLTAVEGSPQYKSSIFDAYARAYPDLLQSVGAKNYDDLLEKSYRQLAKETDQQFKTLPLKMSYHKNGEGNYDNSRELIEDLYGNKHIYVYQGGDKHDFLNRVDPITGLNENEKFRAVHDAFGHGLAGNQFGPKGEEKAWEMHKQMYSPLARFAMTAETRGQNSVANYSPLNAELKQILSEFDRAADIAQRRGDVDSLNRAKAGKRLAFSNFEFAPNRALLLPPEFVESSYSGSMPSYLSGIIRPPAGTETPSVLTHFSNAPNLTATDPTRYGTGIRGAEANRLKTTTNPATDRTYFYGGEPETVIPESGLGRYRYRTEAPMYDISADPMKFNTLAKESNRVPFSSQTNAGLVNSSQQLTDMERLIKEYGYAGFINPNLPKPAGVSFNPLPVERRAIGGLINVKE